MNNFTEAFGAKFAENKDSLRIRTFTLGDHTFKVKVPLTVETDAIYERVKTPDDNKAKAYYENLSKEFLDNKEKFANDKDIEFKENDILIRGLSLLETAKNKVLTENRIVEMIRLLVPENKDFDMSTVTYAEIDELFPFSIQLELLEEINLAISPNYSANRGK